MPALPIRRIAATPLFIPARFDLPGFSQETALSLVLVEIEAGEGLVGHGITAITEEEAVAAVVREVAAPALVGADALAREAIAERLYWLLVPRGQTGYACHAMAAIDLALWDIAGKAAGLPVWRLLGAARPAAPAYVTFGFAAMDREQLAAAAAHWVAQGARRLKMTVGHHALVRRDEPRPVMAVLREDLARIRAVREAVGPDVELFLDANCSLDPLQARWLAERAAEFGIGFFEEPLVENDPRLLAEFRRLTGVPVAAGQNEGLLHRFRALLEAEAVDVLQPNVAIGGGITQCVKAAALARAFNRPIANGGAFAHWNIHLHCGLAHGGMVEYHHAAVLVAERLFGPLPRPADGMLAAPEAPGLGLVPDRASLGELASRPTSRGRGKA
ncbi:MAG: mandelate racemase/muconate lactonizing enzyme family protein [Acetobacteraceae bacterium]|nr:mandelate racemase/muconate lactonizing enzyme family protein [Acetobacteraceae bacterium]MDW8399567.1 mandelate racemase/muconate lactonizing enzyme family protein [Acetobacteraceae bacterium]